MARDVTYTASTRATRLHDVTDKQIKMPTLTAVFLRLSNVGLFKKKIYAFICLFI